MPIQFVCTECGQWMEADEAQIYQPAECPQCGENVPVPEESDRLLAEGTCFYCGEAIDRQDLAEQGGQAEPHDPPTCAACRESIDENDYEIEQERLQRESYSSIIKFVTIAVLAIALVFLLISFLQKQLRSGGRTPGNSDSTLLALRWETIYPGGVSSVSLLAPGVPVRAE